MVIVRTPSIPIIKWGGVRFSKMALMGGWKMFVKNVGEVRNRGGGGGGFIMGEWEIFSLFT